MGITVHLHPKAISLCSIPITLNEVMLVISVSYSLFLITGLGLLVFLDIVHSYSAADEMVGLSLFDGSNDCYFHTGRSMLEAFVTILQEEFVYVYPCFSFIMVNDLVFCIKFARDRDTLVPVFDYFLPPFLH